MQNYSVYQYSATPHSMQQSFARFPLQNSVMSVEECSPQFRASQAQNLAQSKIFIQPPEYPERPYECHEDENYKPQMQFTRAPPMSMHKRVSSHQYPRSPLKRQMNSQCASPCCRQHIPCECEIEQLWEEFLETRLMMRSAKRSCCHQRQYRHY